MRQAVIGLALVLCLCGGYAQAEDARMQVYIDTGQSSRPSLSRAMREALPILLNRLVSSEDRYLADSLKLSPALVSRIVPGEETLVVFHADGVFKALQEAGLAYAPQAPRMNVQLQLLNSIGMNMTQSEEMLAEQLAPLAELWGLQLDDNAPALLVRWQWLEDGNQVMLSVRGNTRLQEFAEIRQLSGGDPVQAVSVWLQEVLVKARDAYVNELAANAGEGEPAMVETILTIRRQLSLPALVAFETQLASDARIRRLIPSFLSGDASRYRIQLKGDNDAWLVNWLSQRGWDVTPAPGGWDAR
ncbi:MAG: hypothetical protein R8K46_05640 [Mariprofundaceae bacterium]